MKHDYSLEKDIFDGGTEYIEDIITDLNIIQITFRDLSGKKRKTLEVVGFNSFNIALDFPEGMVASSEDYTLQLLIGFTFEKSADGYLYCMKTSEHELSFQSKNFPIIRKIEV